MRLYVQSWVWKSNVNPALCLDELNPYSPLATIACRPAMRASEQEIANLGVMIGWTKALDACCAALERAVEVTDDVEEEDEVRGRPLVELERGFPD